VVIHLKASVSFELETYREIVSACTALRLYFSGIGHLVLWWIRTIVLEELAIRSSDLIHSFGWKTVRETLGNQVYILA
jgi:hypothetical protein